VTLSIGASLSQLRVASLLAYAGPCVAASYWVVC
jgi:hypothetical protein